MTTATATVNVLAALCPVLLVVCAVLLSFIRALIVKLDVAERDRDGWRGIAIGDGRKTGGGVRPWTCS